VRYGEIAAVCHCLSSLMTGSTAGLGEPDRRQRCNLLVVFATLEILLIFNTDCFAEICGATSPRRKGLQSKALSRVDFKYEQIAVAVDCRGLALPALKDSV